MRTITAAIAPFVVLWSLFAVAQTEPNGDGASGLERSDRDAIRTIIQAQLDAFRADDADAAFSFASPNIQQRFGDPSQFMRMVKTGYAPVYANRQAFFSGNFRNTRRRFRRKRC